MPGVSDVFVEELKQFVGCELDLFVVELGCSVVAGDEAGAVQAAKVPEHERVATLCFFGCSDFEPEVTLAVLVPRVRLGRRFVDVRWVVPPAICCGSRSAGLR